MEVRDLGEFALIEMLTEMVTHQRKGGGSAEVSGFGLVVDAGDDTAAWRCGRGTELFTTDTVVEGVHFTRATTPWYDLGWKLMAANASDIAAMGGSPLYALVSLGIPPDAQVDHIRLLYQGMLDLANRYGIGIVGGDIVRSSVVFITVALNGVHEADPMLRSSSAPGQQVAVTGFLGSAAGGLELMLKGGEAGPEATAYLLNAHRRPEPCIAQGKLLSCHGVRTAMDISDGLVDDLSKLCKASGVAARLFAEAVPLHPLLGETFKEKSLELALGGGEDYQLLVTAPKKVMERILPLLGPPAAVVGEITAGEPGSVLVVDNTGAEIESSPRGWDHFR